MLAARTYEAGWGCAIERADADIGADAQIGEESQALAVFGDQSDAGGSSFPGMGEANGLTIDEHRAGVRLGTCSEETFEQLGSASAHQAGDAENFAASQSERNVTQAPSPRVPGPGQAEISHVHHHSAGLTALTEMHCFDLPADHQVSDGAGIGFVPVQGLYVAAVAQHRDAVGEAEDFFELVRNVKDGHAAFAQSADDPVEPSHF